MLRLAGILYTVIKVQPSDSIEDFSLSTRLIIKEAWRRGWSVSTLLRGSSHIFVNTGKATVHLQGSILPELAFADGALVNDKYLTYKRLEAVGLEQLNSLRFENGGNLEVALNFLLQNKTVVVKPIDGAHGAGITTGVNTKSKLISAFMTAERASKQRLILIQQQFSESSMYDLRLLCIGGKFIAAIYRIPATVTGDGNRNIRDLIELENSKQHRGEKYQQKYAYIDLESSKSYLGEKFSYVAKEGEKVQVVGTANYGTGGELVDVTDDIPVWMREDAELASKTLSLPVSGVDFLSDTLPKKELSRHECSAVIIEVNKGPSLCIHDEPHIGRNRQTVKRFMDLVSHY